MSTWLYNGIWGYLFCFGLIWPVLILLLKIKIMGFINEFKKFAVQGNVMDLAIGVIIGAAFGKIVSSLIEDIVTPLILKPALNAAHLTKLEDLTLFGTVKYGNFISTIIYFVLIALVLFVVIKALNAAKKKEEAKPLPPAEPTPTEKLLMEIRDNLKK
jgi:large conductance mechanosensitive channel